VYLLENCLQVSEDSTETASELLAVKETTHFTGCVGGGSCEVVLSIHSIALNCPDLKSLALNLLSSLCLNLLRPMQYW